MSEHIDSLPVNVPTSPRSVDISTMPPPPPLPLTSTEENLDLHEDVSTLPPVPQSLTEENLNLHNEVIESFNEHKQNVMDESSRLLNEVHESDKLIDEEQQLLETEEKTEEEEEEIEEHKDSDLVEDVKASKNLIDSPVRLVAGEGGLDFNLERILKAQNPEFEGSKKVLEINLTHKLIKKLPALSSETQKSLCRVLFEQARILDGEMPSNSLQFSKDLIALGLRVE